MEGCLTKTLPERSGCRSVMAQPDHLLLGLPDDVFDLLPAAVYVCDAAGIIVRYNRRAAELWGRSPRPGDSETRFCGALRLCTLEGDVLSHATSPMAQVLRTGIPVRDCEVVIERPDGARVIVLVNIAPLHDAAGRLAGAINCFQDVTARKQAEIEHRRIEEALRESEARFRQLADSAPVLIWMSGPDKGGLYFNKTWLDFTGRRLEQELGQGWLEHVHPEDLPALETCARAFSARVPFSTEFRLRRHDGEWRWMLDTGVPRFTPDGSFAGYIGSCVDITERRESEARLRLAQRAARAITWEWTFAQQTILWSDADLLRELTGVPLANPTRFDDWLALIHPEDRDRHLREAAAAIEAGEGRVEFRIRPPGGPALWLEASGRVTARDAAGRPLRMSGITLDITARRQAEAALREREEWFKLAQEAARIGTYDWDVQAGTIRWSPEMYRLHGIDPATPPEQLYAVWLAALHPEDRARVEREIRVFLERDGPLEIEFRMIMPDGGVRWIHGRGIMLRDNHGRPRRLIGVNLDVTERRAAEEALRASEARYRTLFEQAAVGVVHAALDGRWLLVNGKLCEILGYAREELIGRRFQDLTHPDDLRTDVELVRALDAGEIAMLSREKRYLRKDGRPVWVLVNVSVVRDGQGRPLYRVAVIQDISKRKRAKQRQRLLINELNHRVKNTLATVQSLAAQTLRSTASLEDFQTAFERRLMALSSAHNLLTRENWEGADLTDVLEAGLAPYRGGETTRVHLRGEPVRLSPRAALTLGMAVHELATNAAKYGALSAPSGRIEVDWRTDGGGPGMRWLRITWQETGGPALDGPPRRRGFGSRLIERSLASDLDGEARLEFTATGVRCRIAFPLATTGETAWRDPR